MSNSIPRLAFTALAVSVLAVPALASAQEAASVAPQATIGLIRAVQAAEQALPGRALEADLDFEDGRQVYEVELTSDGALHEIRIDAFTGDVVSTRKHAIESLWSGWSDRLATIERARPLAETLAAVEKQTGGRVREVGVDNEDGGLYYEIELASGSGERDVYVDVASGRIIADMVDD